MVFNVPKSRGHNIIPQIDGIECRYCGYSDPRFLVYCAEPQCKKWFCNGRTADMSSSHIVEHGVLSAHQKVAFWNDVAWRRSFLAGGRDTERAKNAQWVASHCTTQPQCYDCDERNVFELGVADKTYPWIARYTSCRADTVKFNTISSGKWHPFKTCHEKNFVCFASWDCRIPPMAAMKIRPNKWAPGEDICRDFLKDLEEWTRRSENGVILDFLTWRGFRQPVGSLATLEKTDYIRHYRCLVDKLRQLEIDACEGYVGLTSLNVAWIPDSDYNAIVDLPFGLHSDRIHPGQRITLRWDDVEEPFVEQASITNIAELTNMHKVTIHVFTPVSWANRIDGRGYSLKFEYNPIVYDRMLAALRKIESNEPDTVSPEIRAVLLDSFYGPLREDRDVSVKTDPGPDLANDYSVDNFNTPTTHDNLGVGSRIAANFSHPVVPSNHPFGRSPNVVLLPPNYNPAVLPIMSNLAGPVFPTLPGMQFTLTINPNGLHPLEGPVQHSSRPGYGKQDYQRTLIDAIMQRLQEMHWERVLNLHRQQCQWNGLTQQQPYWRQENGLLVAATPDSKGPYASYPRVMQPPGLRTLNAIQRKAVNTALENSVTLIQGPPGTGKTVTAAAIAYNIAVESAELCKILYVAASNLAVDHLADQIGKTGIAVARMYASSRDLPTRSNLNFEIVPREKDAVVCHQIICVTCNCAGMACLKDLSFPYVIIDECTQAMEPDALLVLIGEQEQLGSVITHRELQGSSLAKSLFERLAEQPRIPQMMLRTQYRMNPQIREMINGVTYGKNGGLDDGFESKTEVPYLAEISYLWPKPLIPMVFVHVPAKQEYSGNGRSLLNVGEAHFIARLVANLAGQNEVLLDNIGVISFYRGQMSHLRDQLAHHPCVNRLGADRVEVASVDGFQGREKEVIILSCVRLGDKKKIHGFGFTEDRKRLNVAMSRARAGLIVVGNADLYRQSSVWMEYFKWLPIVRVKDIGSQLPIKCSSYSMGYGGIECSFCDSKTMHLTDELQDET